MAERKKSAAHRSKSKSPRPSRHHASGRRHELNASRSASRRSRTRSRSRSRDRKYQRHESPLARKYSFPVGRQRLMPSRGDNRFRGRGRYNSPSPPGDRQRFDNLADPSRVLGVFGLSVYTDERVLKEVFTQYGPVEDIQLITDHQTGISRGFAFVYMRYLEDAIQARALIPGTEIDGRKIRVDYSVTDRGRNQNSAGFPGRPPVRSPPGASFQRRSPPPRSQLRGNATRNFRGRSRSYSPRRF